MLALAIASSLPDVNKTLRGLDPARRTDLWEAYIGNLTAFWNNWTMHRCAEVK